MTVASLDEQEYTSGKQERTTLYFSVVIRIVTSISVLMIPFFWEWHCVVSISTLATPRPLPNSLNMAIETGE
ncbi:hypothetical protein ASPSYDRAFT_48865 [Aspergillus sydowii CBS 593.65]|uniref:Uncharacterized protein n=1 Tax=Aspergillus sydowii CBS 593.65 TaxID=1036612 RepID=A0A1L9T8A9_9EURO|nr:uncharacterized protein ASPSYDRAFT_48865 [Aspergillus sydowii CBS 593.65]OJJ55657.1 hypothetical protein ASPSYDRAFT_48865 [Aspergillus sydowii CBS 593.65]